MKMTKKEINELKREVAKATGLKMKDIAEITMISDTTISYGYYETYYDRVINHMTYATIDR